jgi:excinuclease ABC subunit C
LPKDIGIERPCLYYHIKQCKAPCQGYITEADYRKSINEVIEFLNGNYTLITKDLQAKMQKASEDLEFEVAAEYRDLLMSVEKLSQVQKASDTDAVDRDIIAFASTGDEAVAQVFFIRDGKMLGRDHFHITGVANETRSSIMTNFVKQFYSGTPYIPKELLLSEPLEEEQLIADWLSAKRGLKVRIHVPQKGDKERLVELAEKNASLVLQQDSEKLQKEEARTYGAMKQISEMIDLPTLCRMESYDISNINGFESVGSMVVYENGKPKKNDYRKFKIRSVQGSDDYASMREVLTRRFAHGLKEAEELRKRNIGIEHGSFTRYPDLILMDGGRGQVNIALSVLEELNMNIAVCGMVKDDNHRTRGLYYHNVEIPIDTHSEAFKLITRIQDETHRFAIEYHRSLRSKSQVKSILDDIDGVGDMRRRALMKHFQSLDAIKAATVDELNDLPSMNRLSAQKVYNFFHANTSEY